MNGKTYSQKVAAVFEIIGYVLLLPMSFGLMGSFFMLVIGLAGGAAEPVLISFLFILMVAAGLYLLVGYYRHGRGSLSQESVFILWKATAAYNFVLLLPWLIAAAVFLQFREGLAANGNWFVFFISIAIVALHATVIYFSLKAHAFENRKK
ncbi:MAG TPA: hypothetical protein VIL74_04125 [Pyrinomonadaceae bacterium]|jgi:hypothetical protein